MAFQLVNFLEFTLATGIEAGDTQLTVLDADLANATVYNPAMQLALTLVGETADQHEIVYVTARVGTTLTILRGREGTAARGWGTGTRIVAAPTVGVLTALTTQGTAIATSYVPNGLVRGSNVQDALDNAAALIAGAGLEPPLQVTPVVRNEGDKFTTNYNTDLPFGQDRVGRLTTGGLGAVVKSPQTPSIPSSAADRNYVAILRVSNLADLDYVEVGFQADASNYRYVRLSASKFTEGNWTVVPIAPAMLTQVGSAAAPLTSSYVSVKDDGTGVVNLDIASVSVYDIGTGGATILRQVNTIDDIRSLVELSELPFSVMAVIDYTKLGAVFTKEIMQFTRYAGIGIVLTTAIELRTQTSAQVQQLLFDMLQRAAQVAVSVQGFLFPSNYYGKLTPDPTVRLVDLVSRYFERGYYYERIRGFSGLETPWLTPVFQLTSAETVAALTVAPYNNLVIDISNFDNTKTTALLGADGSALRANYSVPVAANFAKAITQGIQTKVSRSGDRMTGALSSAVKEHGTLGSVTEQYNYADGNVHAVTINGTHVIDPIGLAEGDSMQINILYQSGGFSVSGTTQWDLGQGVKSSNLGDLGLSLKVGASYRLILVIVRGLRTGVVL